MRWKTADDVLLNIVCLSILIPLMLFCALMFLLYVVPTGAIFYFAVLAVISGNLLSKRILKEKSTSFVRYLLLIASCIAVLLIMFKFSFGVFTYQNYEAVCGVNVRGCLPEAATEITVEASDHHHAAKFRITQGDLDAWHDRRWKEYGNADQERKALSAAGQFSLTFGHLGWSEPSDAICYFGPRAGMSPGYTVWFSPSTQVAYLYFGYW